MTDHHLTLQKIGLLEQLALRCGCLFVTQLRGEAGDRQVPGDPRLGFTHVYGAPGISACTVLEGARR